MDIKFSDLTRDISIINQDELLSDWAWLVGQPKKLLIVTKFGDLFFTDMRDEVFWLDTGAGLVSKVANSIDDFEEMAKDEEKFAEWFLTDLYLQLRQQKILLQDNEVYSFQTLPIFGGRYSAENFKPTDISVHFAITGQICQNLKDIPDGTKIKLEIDGGKKPWWKPW